MSSSVPMFPSGPAERISYLNLPFRENWKSLPQESLGTSLSGASNSAFAAAYVRDAVQLACLGSGQSESSLNDHRFPQGRRFDREGVGKRRKHVTSNFIAQRCEEQLFADQ